MKTIRELINLIESAQNPVKPIIAWVEPATCSTMSNDEYENNPFANETGDWKPIHTQEELAVWQDRREEKKRGQALGQNPVAEDWIDDDAAEPLARHFAELYYNGLSSADEAKMAARVYQQVVDGEMSIEQLKQHIAKLEKEKGVAEGKIQYGVLDNDNVNLIIDKSESKPDGIYSFRGILFKVTGGKVTHYATDGKILQAMGRFNTQIGSYDSSSQAKSILKGIKEGVAEGETSQQYTVAVDCGEDGTFTVKVHAADKGEALRKAQKIVRNEYDTYPEGARIVGQGVAEALSKTDLLKQVSAKLNDPEFRKQPADPTKSFTKGDHWQGAKPGDYGYTGYQGHGMPTDRAERARIRADKKKQQDK